jgi:hypothetical protein
MSQVKARLAVTSRASWMRLASNLIIAPFQATGQIEILGFALGDSVRSLQRRLF